MADIINMQELADAKLDAQSLEQFINGGVDEDVLTRLSQQYPTIKKLLLEFQKYNGRAYKTYAEMDADKANLSSKTKVTVTNDTTASNNGDWQWDGVAFTKSAFDPLAQAKADASTKAQAAETNAKLAAQNTDVKLLTSIQQIVDAITQFRNDYDVDLAALSALINSNDTQANTRITRLLVALQQVVQVISENRDELDVLIAENLAINSPITRLLVSIQQIVQTFSENRDEIDTLIASNTNAINASTTSITRLLVSFQTLNYAVSQLTEDTSDLILSDQDKLKKLINTQEYAVALANLDGFDPKISGSEAINVENALTFAKPNNLICIRLNGDVIPTAKGTVKKGDVLVDIDGVKLHLPCTYEVQGNGSAQYSKKNLTIGFFKDETFVDTQTVKIGPVIPHDEWVFKANYIDSTHTRQISSYMLWSQMMQSRASWPQRDIDNFYVGKTGLDAIDTGAIGHPIGWPCVVYFNDEFYGIGDFQIGKKRANYNIPKNSPLMIQMEPDGQNIDITDWTNAAYEMKAPSKPNSDTAAAMLAWDTFAQSAQADFTANIATYTNKQNIIDYYLLVQFLAATDCVGANFNFVTWDGTRWYFMPYDLDSVYGLEVTGTVILNTVNQSMTEFSRPRQPSKDFWKKVEIAYATDINTRYAQLRDAGIFTVKNVLKNIHQLNDKYTADLFKAEYAKWTALPSVNITNIGQIATWVQARLVFLDTKFSY
ncbi:CotH kinase family protein [Acinetobacter johnsonii]|uniref:CotH kinase family protein n=1 Tax=Acinetobacter johnsonii TaxID=40214 RepID=UPI00244768CD|nr:CotH kinase family protein [Acinetobacter johnsonii]MDH2046526.1 CotH kinase family protein [Acinetobacter johnsonii]